MRTENHHFYAGRGHRREFLVLATISSATVNGAYPVEVNAGRGDTFIVIVVNNTPKLFQGRYGGLILFR
jgi:hypothetical protein